MFGNGGVIEVVGQKMSYIDVLLLCNSRGLINAPEESDESFMQRCHEAKVFDKLEGVDLVGKLFDIKPDWVEVVYSDHKLSFFEGGCTWVEGGKASLQLRSSLKDRKKYFGYLKEEIVAHELVHFVRSSFNEPRFEEILAYKTSSFWFRRFFGPIFRSAKESVAFLMIVCCSAVTSFFEHMYVWSWLASVLLVTFIFARLFYSQYIFGKCRANISNVVGEKRALSVMLRLTDREIARFSRMKKEDIVAYADKMSKIRLRWKQIMMAYIRPVL